MADQRLIFIVGRQVNLLKFMTVRCEWLCGPWGKGLFGGLFVIEIEVEVVGSSHETTNQVGSMSVTGGLGVRPSRSGPWLCQEPSPVTMNDALKYSGGLRSP